MNKIYLAWNFVSTLNAMANGYKSPKVLFQKKTLNKHFLLSLFASDVLVSFMQHFYFVFRHR